MCSTVSGGDMAHTTVAKVLDRLDAKGEVGGARSFRYSPVRAESNWVADQVKGSSVGRGTVLRCEVLIDGLDVDDIAVLAGLLEQAQHERFRVIACQAPPCPSAT